MISRKRLLAVLTIVICLGAGAFASSAPAAAPAWQPIAVTGPTNIPPVQSETQRVGVDAEGGTFTLTFNAQTTAPIAFDAPASAVESALNALSSVGGAGGSVSVAGGPGGVDAENPYLVTFGGSFANSDVAEMSTNSSSLSGSGKVATVITSVPGGPGTSLLAIYVQNIGGQASSGTITVSVDLPPGVTTSGTPVEPIFSKWICSPGAGQQSFSCTATDPIAPGATLQSIRAPLVTDPSASGTQAVEVTVSGGSAASPASYSMPLAVSSTPAEAGIQSFFAGAYDQDGEFDTRAGGHPFSGSTAIFANTYRNHFGRVIPVGEFKDIEVDLPPGFLGNPISVPECPERLLGVNEFEGGCSANTIVGRATAVIGQFGEGGINNPVYNVEAPFGYPGKFFFEVAEVPIHAVGSVRSDGDYGLTVGSLNTAQIANVYGSFFTFWGTPADPSHDKERCEVLKDCDQASTVPETAFLTSPTDCAREAVEPPHVRLRVSLWGLDTLTRVRDFPIPAVEECDKLEFEADFTFEPSDTKSDSTASFRTSLTVPSEGLTDPEKLMTPPIKDAVVTLPEGVVLNAAGADGLQACSLQQIGYLGKGFGEPNPMRFSKAPQTCPEASKIGTGELKTVLLANPLKGALYLAAQGDGNPYGSLFAIYLVIEDPQTGIYIKLPGRVDPDEQTGQMKVTFQNLPQLPFSRLDLNLKGGNRSALASPTTCGDYVTTATNTPWSAPESGPPTVSANGFTINQGPNGMPCAPTKAERPFDIGWSAGSESTQASASAPFHMRITRADGSQELTALELKTPSGVSASLKGVPRCTEAQIDQARNSTGKAEQANSACPAASKVGTLTTGAGSGPSPFYVSGNLYLAGPYKGAPLSVVAVTPAVAGPFDLGNVVVRNAVKIDRHSAQVFAQSDEIPQILKGVALRIRDVRIKLDRDNWTINPTSCEASKVELSAKGANGAVANRDARFQVGGCSDLAFKPKLTAKVIGGTKRNKYPAFEAKLTVPEGSKANIKDVQVTLPHSQFLEQAHIRTICTRVQAAALNCPQGSIYGFAEAETPLLDGKLTGPVFLKSSNNKLPDLAIFLKGPDSEPVEVEFQGRIDSVNESIRNTIEGLPDVPVSSFTLKMKGGQKGLLVNSRNLCKGKPGRLTVRMVGQNNKSFESRPRLGNSCKSKGKTKKGKKAKAKRGNAKQLATLVRSW